MSTTEITHYDVHLGFWTNWSHGKIQGGTVTLTRKHGGFLIAFLAIFIGMVGKSFWRLSCFALHRYFSSTTRQDGLYHQRQTILRNSDTAQDGAWRLLMTLFAWRSGRRARSPILRLLPVIVAAFVIAAAFGIASIFSSNVTSEDLNQVLLKGKRCGVVDIDRLPLQESLVKQLTVLFPLRAAHASKMLNYGRQCYVNETNIDGCNLYIKSQLPLTSTRGTPCPFGGGICKLDDDNLIMDSGMLDSLEHFGINTGPDQRFQMRMRWECAPIKSEGYTTNYNDTEYGILKRFMYGSKYNVRRTHPWTYELPANHAFLPADNTSSSSIPRLDYQLGSAIRFAHPNTSYVPGVNEWIPIPELFRNDGDVNLMFMSAPEIHYSGPVNDPWFSAHTGASEVNERESKSQFQAWKQDGAASTMACIQQMQYCNPNLPENERCEPLRGLYDPRKSDTVEKIFPNERQIKTIAWVDNIFTGGLASISEYITNIGAAALRARYNLVNGYSFALPDNQWQIEAEHLAKATLTELQDNFVTTANGIAQELEDFRSPPEANNTVANNLCVNQKIVSNRYSSFNVLGLSLILVLGILIIILDMTLEPMVASWQRRKYHKLQARDEEYPGSGPHPLYPVLEWSQTNMLQLQRLAQEEAGYGEWSNCDKDVPVTEPGQLLASLDLRKLTHPLQDLKPGLRYDFGSLQAVVAPEQSMYLRRSDTGLETLVEEAAEMSEKKAASGKDEPEVTVSEDSIERASDRPAGLGVQLNDKAMDDDIEQDWRTLR